MKQFLVNVGNGIFKMIHGGAIFVAKHPTISYFLIGVPACALMYNGALGLAGQNVDLSDEIKKEEK